MGSPSSTNDKIETGIFRIFNHFSRMWRMRDKYRADIIGERANPWPTPTSTLKKKRREIVPEISSLFAY